MIAEKIFILAPFSKTDEQIISNNIKEIKIISISNILKKSITSANMPPIIGR